MRIFFQVIAWAAIGGDVCRILSHTDVRIPARERLAARMVLPIWLSFNEL